MSSSPRTFKASRGAGIGSFVRSMSAGELVKKLIDGDSIVRSATTHLNPQKNAQQLIRLARLTGNQTSLWLRAARILDEDADPAAEEAYLMAVKSGGVSGNAWYSYGRWLENAARFEEALAAFAFAQQFGADPGHMAFRQARCMQALGNLVGAAVKFRESAGAGFDPQKCYTVMLQLLGDAAPKWVKLELLREGQPHFGATDEWTFERARLSAQMCFHEDAVECFDMLRQHHSLNTADTILYVDSLEALGESRRARQILVQACQALPKHESDLGPGVLYEKRGRWSNARTEFERTLKLDPENSELIYRIGFTYDREYKWGEALSHFETALARDPFAARLGYRAYKAGHAAERLADYERAAAWYWAALQDDPSQLHWWYRYGTCLLEIGEHALAYSALTRSLAEGDTATEASGDTSADAIPANLGFLAATAKWSEARDAWFRNFSSASLKSDVTVEETLSLAEHAATLDLEHISKELATRSTVHSLTLTPSERLRAAALLNSDEASRELAVTVLRDSRRVRLPDGVDLKKYLPAGRSRSTRLYAELCATRQVDPQVVLFESNHGASASCHPLAVMNQMLRDPRFDDKIFVWAVNDLHAAPKDTTGSARIYPVELGSDDYLYHLATAKYLINNVSFPPYFTRREEQRYLNTWHGTPMKTLGRSMRQGLVEYENLERNFIQASHLLAPNELTKNALLEDHHLDGIYPGSVGMIGSPRLDNLIVSGSALRDQIRHQLGVEETERFVLVAPTWRGGVSSHDLDQDALVEQLRALSNIPGTRIFYRAHRLTEKLVQGMHLPVEVVPADIDTNDLLAAVDHLVTDYSSILFDFMVTRRPITLYVPDLQQYRDERGLYLLPEELPVGIATTVEQLVDEVETSEISDPAAYARAVERYCAFEDGEASARCVDFFLSDHQRGLELNHKPTVLLRGSLIPNGIASSLLAILDELVLNKVNVLLMVEPSVLRQNADRASIFHRLPQGVRLISRLGEPVMTPEEYYIRSVVESGGSEPGEDMKDRYRASWVREARRVVGDIPIDVAIEWDGYATLWGGIMAHVGSAATTHMVWQHNDMAEEQEHKYPELATMFQMYPWFERVVSVSDLLAATNSRYFEPLGLLPSSGVSAVPNLLTFTAIHEKAQQALDPEHTTYFSGQGPVVLTIGRLSMEKNHQALIDSWHEVLKQFPAARLLVVGSGPLESLLRAEVMRQGLGDSVVLLGQITNPYPLLRSADLFVLPSLHEGQPIVLFEAMALGTPVAASPCPGNIEAMNNGYGVVIPTESAELGSAIADVLHDLSPARGEFDTDAHHAAAFERFSVVAGLFRQ